MRCFGATADDHLPILWCRAAGGRFLHVCSPQWQAKSAPFCSPPFKTSHVSVTPQLRSSKHSTNHALARHLLGHTRLMHHTRAAKHLHHPYDERRFTAHAALHPHRFASAPTSPKSTSGEGRTEVGSIGRSFGRRTSYMTLRFRVTSFTPGRVRALTLS